MTLILWRERRGCCSRLHSLACRRDVDALSFTETAVDWDILAAPAFLSPRPTRPSPHQSLLREVTWASTYPLLSCHPGLYSRQPVSIERHMRWRPVNSPHFGRGDAQRPHSSAAATTPTACPACQSSSITTTARNPNENTYWRCIGCGEIWNVSRGGAGPSRPYRWP
jgi:hypothetical protein